MEARHNGHAVERMSASGRVGNFTPSTNGFHFDNDFQPGTHFPITLPVVGTISADAKGGVCGGFVFAALDLFHHGPQLGPTSDTVTPVPGQPLFTYLSSRFNDSFGAQPACDNGVKAIAWTQIPGHDEAIPIQGPGLAHRMVFDEWPAIKADIDAGNPSPLYLVMDPQCGIDDIVGIVDALAHSHQVLAYGYELDDSNNVTLNVYDCNDADNNDSTISFNIGTPANTMTISAVDIESRFTAPHPVRGIFRSHYIAADPTRWNVNFPVIGAPPVPPPAPECASLAAELRQLQTDLRGSKGNPTVIRQIVQIEAKMRQLGCPP